MPTPYTVRVDWNDDLAFSGTEEDVSQYVRSSPPLSVTRGSDQFRDIAPPMAGAGSFDLVNTPREFSAENSNATQFANLHPGHQVQVKTDYCTITFSATNATNSCYDSINGLVNYTLQTGDVLNYDVMWNSATDFEAIDLDDNAGHRLKDSAAVDQYGFSCNPQTNISALANGIWYARSISIPASMVGKTIVNFLIGMDKTGSNTGGTAFFRNIFISNSNLLINLPLNLNPGYFLSFDGSTTYVNKTSPSASYTFSAGDSLTFSCWAFFNNFTNAAYLYTKDTGAGNFGDPSIYVTTAGKPRLAYTSTVPSQVQAEANIVLSTGMWHNIVWVYTFGTALSAQCYVDGIAISTSFVAGAGTETVATNSSEVELGRFANNTGYLNGCLREVYLFRRILPQADVNKLYYIDHSLSLSSIVFYYQTLEGSGTSIFDTGGLGNTGTLTGTGTPLPLWQSIYSKFNIFVQFDSNPTHTTKYSSNASSAATAIGFHYYLYQAALDNLSQNPAQSSLSVTFPLLGNLSKLVGKFASTALYQNITTDVALGHILDAVGIPNNATWRNFDSGTVTLNWWWMDGTKDAFTEASTLVFTEGPGAKLIEDAQGVITFQNRTHRYTQTLSNTSQATFNNLTPEPTYTNPFTYDPGLKDIVNVATSSINFRSIKPVSTIWTYPNVPFNLAPNQTMTIVVTSNGGVPFINASKILSWLVSELGPASVTLDRTSGSSCTITIVNGISSTTVTGLVVNAQLVSVDNTQALSNSISTTTSQANYGVRLYQNPVSAEIPFVIAQGLLDSIVSIYQNPRPTVIMTLVNANWLRFVQQLTRAISDRITIVEPQTGLNGDLWVEQIGHSITAGIHTTTFGLEKVWANTGYFIVGTSQLDVGILGY